MKWAFAALAFALVVGLAVATASIQAGNLERRARIEEWTKRLRSAQIELAAERARWAEATRLERLVELWSELDRKFGGDGS